jgi:hypothetical protein
MSQNGNLPPTFDFCNPCHLDSFTDNVFTSNKCVREGKNEEGNKWGRRG